MLQDQTHTPIQTTQPTQTAKAVWILAWIAWLLCVLTAFGVARLIQVRKHTATGGITGALVLNNSGDIVEWGQDAQRLMGWTPSEMFGCNFFNLMEHPAQCSADFAYATEYGSKWFRERTCPMRRKDGKYFDCGLRLVDLEPGIRFLAVIEAR